MNNSPVKSELYVALEMVELTQFLPFTNSQKFSSHHLDLQFIFKFLKIFTHNYARRAKEIDF